VAHLVRQSKTYYVTAAGKRFTKKTRGAKKVTEKSKKWYGASLPGQGAKRFPLATDKAVAARMLADLVTECERGTANMATRKVADSQLEPLVTEFLDAVLRRSTEKFTDDVGRDVRRVLAACKLRTIADLRGPDVAASAEAYLFGLVKGKEAFAGRTAASIGEHAKSFTKWLVRKKKLLVSDPLVGMDMPSPATAHPRRDLNVEELNAVIQAAEKSMRVSKHLSGPDRAILYTVAAATGFRSGELAQLTPSSLDLTGDVPVARLAGKQTKNGKPAVQPIPPALAARLRTYIAGRPADKPIWPGLWHKRCADMLRVDLAAAGVPEVTAAGVALFHSLRHSFTSMLTASASVKVTQELVRHSSPNLTVGTYSHSSLKERAAAVAALPLPGEGNDAEPFARMTRTELEQVAQQLLIANLLLISLVTRGVTHKDGIPADYHEPVRTKEAE